MEKKVQTYVWLFMTVLLCWTASLSCLAQPCLPFSPLPEQAEVPLLSPHPEGHGGCAWAWLGWGGRHGAACPAIASSRRWRSSVWSWQCPQRSLPSSRLSSGPMLLLPIFHKQNENQIKRPIGAVERRRADCAARAGLRAGHTPGWTALASL